MKCLPRLLHVLFGVYRGINAHVSHGKGKAEVSKFSTWTVAAGKEASVM